MLNDKQKRERKKQEGLSRKNKKKKQGLDIFLNF